MTLKIMLDTNSYDFIYENKLTEKFNQLIEKGEIENFGTHVQVDEIKKISDQKRKNHLKKISCKLIPSEVGFIGVDYESQRGFNGAKIGGYKIVGNEDNEIITAVKTSPTQTHPLGNSADITIVFTSMKNSLDFLISDNDDIHKIFNKMNKKMNSNVKILTNDEFKNRFLV